MARSRNDGDHYGRLIYDRHKNKNLIKISIHNKKTIKFCRLFQVCYVYVVLFIFSFA